MEMSRSMDSQSFDEGSCEESMESGLILKKGPWTPAEDAILVEYVNKHGEGNWNAVQKNSGLFRCGKSCRLRWANHLRPNLKKGAFTAEEERLIIELHSKMGNKWARMAANLPGRTDNEIKNYWNTRIKRRQRAGLPLYPPEVCLKALSESHQSPSNNGFSAGNTQHQDLLQDDSYEIPDVIFENLNANPGVLSYPTAFSDISVGSSLGQGLSSSHTRSFMPPPISHRPKRPRESENLFSGLNGSFTSGLPPIYQFQNYTGDKIRRPYGLAFPYNPDPDPDPKANNFPMFCGKLNGNALLDSNFSASKPIPGAVKLELPSFQYSDNELGNWETSSPPPTSFESVDAFIQSPPPTEQVQSDCLTSDNSGLLEAVLHGSHSLNSSKNQSPETGSNLSFATTTGGIINSLNQCDTGLEGLNDPISPLSRSAASVFGECTPVSRSSISDPPDTSAFPGSNVKVEPVEQVLSSDTTSKEISTKMNISARPDALLGACWFGQRNNITKEHPMTDAIASFLGEDFSSDYKDASAGTSTTQGFELGSIPWNNMPGFHQMFELPKNSLRFFHG